MQFYPSKAIGIDFGTTNSSIGYVAGESGKVRLVEFPTTAGSTRSSRSVLYCQQNTSAGRKSVSVSTGPSAIKQYLATDSFDTDYRSRLIQSLKSYLSARSLAGTEIFGRQYQFVDLLARMLGDLRRRASEELGFEVRCAMAGRPVSFVGAETEADNDFATERLHQAFQQAGFTEVRFAMEPVAAAWAYEPAGEREETLLIGDFGGGTTDFSLLRIGASRKGAGESRERKVLGNTGVGIAGDAFDARIVRRLISPALGSESEAKSLSKTLPALPAWVFANLERWHTLSFLRTHAVMNLLRATEKRALEPEKIAALIAIVENDLGYQMHQAVQRVKIELSHRQRAEFSLDTDPLQLRAEVTRAEFEGWIAPEIGRMQQSLDDLLRDTGMGENTVDRVFLTGGTSLVPAVRRVFTSRFGEERVTTGEAFTSVAYGLALMAREQFS